MNAAQLNYTVGEKELLGIVEGMKAFEGMIKGYNITIHTDHLNLLHKNCRIRECLGGDYY